MGTIVGAVGSNGSSGGSGGSSPGSSAPVVIPYSSAITPDAATGNLFRVIATGNLTLNDPVNGVDGQTVVIEIQASGADRILSFGSGGINSIPILSGEWWVGTLRYISSATTWLIADGG